MIDHLSITTTDLDRARIFHDAVLGTLGYPRVNRRARSIGYGVRAFHEAAIRHSGADDGPPGLRPEYHHDCYGAFVRDPDGNRIEAVTHQREDKE